jgi:hypothetical protein
VAARGGTAAQDACSCLAHVAGDPGDGEWTALRAEVARILAQSIGPTDHPIVRWLLEQETAAAHDGGQGEGGQGESGALYTLIAALAHFARVEDALLIWRAREATSQTRAGVDVEQMARAGVDGVRRYLRSIVEGAGAQARDAANALAWLEEGVASGAFADLTAYFAWADERFGLHVSGPT